MITLDNFLDNASVKSFDENFEDIKSSLDESNTQFEECFNKIFGENKFFDIDPNNECDLFSKLQGMQNPNNCLLFKDNLNEKSNSLNSNENNTDKTSDKSKESLQKNEVKDKDLFFEQSSSSHIDDYKNNNSIKDYNKSINTIEFNEQENNDINIIINQEDKKESDEEEEESITFLGKKRNIIRIEYPEDFSIFTSGEYNQFSKQMIQQALAESYKKENEKRNIETGMGEFSGPKKPHKKKLPPKRKINSDNIRKKIKARFLKVLKNTVNEKLKMAGSKKFFSFLPQCFISNVSKEKNRAVLNLTYKEVFSKNFCEDEKGARADLKKYYHNLSVLEYLEKNKEISKKSNFDYFKNMKYSQIYEEYFNSKEFEMEIASLKQEKENEKYIKEYIIKASNFIDFFIN